MRGGCSPVAPPPQGFPCGALRPCGGGARGSSGAHANPTHLDLRSAAHARPPLRPSVPNWKTRPTSRSSRSKARTFYRQVYVYPPSEPRPTGPCLELRQGTACDDEWIRLDQATFTGFLSWTPRILFTDVAVPYSLRVASERTRAYRLTCQVDACLFVHPTSFATELDAVHARRELQRDLAKLADWDLLDETATRVDHPRFEIPAFEVQRDDAATYRIEMMAPAAIYRHPDTFPSYGDAKLTLRRDPGPPRQRGRAAIADPSRLIQALDGESEPWDFDPQARKKSREYSFFNLGLGRQAWANSFAMWNRDRFRGTTMLREGATVRVTATPSLYRDRIQWRVRDFQLVSPAVHDVVAA